MIEVLRPGALATIQDLGRAGYARLGVARSGAFDRAALRSANRLVGNPAEAAGIEVTLGGLALRAVRAVTVALTGAACPGLDVGVAVSLAAGTTVTLGIPAAGVRSYLAVRGGICVPLELGSRSTDTLGRLGPVPLRAGDLLPVGPQPAGSVGGTPAVPRVAGPLRVTPGPREDWFADPIAALTAGAWSVRADSDRIGVRLDGPALRRIRTGELPSEALLPGALQVPPGGGPVLLGPDAPTTGGYPVIAVVVATDLDAAAQLRPGDTVRFRSATGAGSPT